VAQVNGIQLKLIRILAEELDTNEDIAPLEPHKVYYLPTPYDSFSAGEILMQAMQLSECDGECLRCASSTLQLTHLKRHITKAGMVRSPIIIV
jgi:hypothetical protein